MKCILAIDCGTTSIKASCVSLNLQIVKCEKSPCVLFQPSAEQAEQDADAMWNTICKTSKSCTQDSEIVAIVFSAPWKHIIALDENGKPLRKSIIWMDSRASKQANEIKSLLPDFEGTGQEYWPRLKWLKENEPLVWEKAKHIVGLNTYFKYKATGNFSTECSDDFIRSPQKELNSYYSKILSAIGLTAQDLEKFPFSISSDSIAGYLKPKAASQMGLNHGIPVFSGYTDLSAIAAGSDSNNLGDIHIYLGTSSWFGEMQAKRLDNYSNLYCTVDKDKELALFSIQTGGRALDWIIDKFYYAERNDSNIYALVDNDIRATPAASEGLIATHWFNGELAPLSKDAKAVFFNITEKHDRKYFARAILESICYSHRWALEKYCALHNSKPQEINVVGGGANSKPWMQMLADILQVTVTVPENPRYIGTIGSCLCALKALGIDKCSILPEKTKYIPNPKLYSVYNQSFKIYSGLYPALKDLYKQSKTQK